MSGYIELHYNAANANGSCGMNLEATLVRGAARPARPRLAPPP